MLALDMYEHAYSLEFGANATAYINAFIRNIDWAAVSERLREARACVPRRSETRQGCPSLHLRRGARGTDRQGEKGAGAGRPTDTLLLQGHGYDGRRRVARS